MPRRILFAVGQSATVAYLAPVWRRWLLQDKTVSWRVIAAPPAALRIDSEGRHDIPSVTIDHEDITEFRAALGNWMPECVVMSASFAPMERAAIALARTHGLPLARIIDTWYGYRRRLLDPTGNIELPDRLLVIDDAAAREAISEGIPASILKVVGQPAWENVPVLAPGDRRDILFVSQPIERFYGNSLGYTEKSVWKLFLSTMRAYPHLARRIYYSAHPDDDMPEPNEPDVTVVKSGLATLPLVGTVVGMFSSLVTDALLSGRHVISFQPGGNGHNMCEMGRGGLVPRAMTPEELAQSLSGETPDVSSLRATLKGSIDRVETFCLNFSHQ